MNRCPHCGTNAGAKPARAGGYRCNLCGGPRLLAESSNVALSGNEVPLLKDVRRATYARWLWMLGAGASGLAALAGYTIANVTVRAVSAGASAQAIDARVQEGLTVAFEALPLPGAAGRTDEYRLSVLFRRGSDQSTADCTVLVRAPSR